MSFVNLQKGKGIWKFNCSLFKKHLDYIDMVDTLTENEKYIYALPVYNIDNINKVPNSDIQFTINDSCFLEMVLLKIRGETIKFSTKLRRELDKNSISDACTQQPREIF